MFCRVFLQPWVQRKVGGRKFSFGLFKLASRLTSQLPSIWPDDTGMLIISSEIGNDGRKVNFSLTWSPEQGKDFRSKQWLKTLGKYWPNTGNFQIASLLLKPLRPLRCTEHPETNPFHLRLPFHHSCHSLRPVMSLTTSLPPSPSSRCCGSSWSLHSYWRLVVPFPGDLLSLTLWISKAVTLEPLTFPAFLYHLQWISPQKTSAFVSPTDLEASLNPSYLPCYQPPFSGSTTISSGNTSTPVPSPLRAFHHTCLVGEILWKERDPESWFLKVWQSVCISLSDNTWEKQLKSRKGLIVQGFRGLVHSWLNPGQWGCGESEHHGEEEERRAEQATTGSKSEGGTQDQVHPSSSYPLYHPLLSTRPHLPMLVPAPKTVTHHMGVWGTVRIRTTASSE